MDQPHTLPKPYKPSVDEIVNNVAADMQIEGFRLTPAEIEHVRTAVIEDLQRRSRPDAYPV
jgi:hypothetical protein